MALLRQLTILQRLIIMLVLAAIGTFVFASFSILEQRSNLVTQKTLQIEGQLNTAASLLSELEKQQVALDVQALLSALNYGANGTFVVLDQQGKRLNAASGPMQHIQDNQWRTLANSAKGQTFTTEELKIQLNGESDNLLLGARPYAQQQWILVTAALESEINQTTFKLAMNYLVIMLLISIPIFAFFLVLNRSISYPLGQAIAALENIANGDGDLTQQLDSQGKDEVAALSRAFNEFVNKLGNTINQLKPLGMDLDNESRRLQSAVSDANTSAEHVHTETSAVVVAVNQMLTTTQEMASSTQQAADSATSVRHQADNSLVMMSQTTQSIQALATELSQSRGVTESLEHASNQIGDILDVIRGISEQTNLLALNAAIEAARAGEMGRGFAVVADEVRALANRTQSSTEQIQKIIQEIQQGVTAVLASNETTQNQSSHLQQQAEQVANSMEAILTLVNQISDMNTQLASATEEQSLVTAEISKNVGNIGELTEVALQANQSNANAANQLQHMSEQITHGLGQFKA